MPTFISVPTISDSASKLVPVYSVAASPLSELDRRHDDKAQALVPIELRDFNLYPQGLTAVKAVRQMLAKDGKAISWLDNLRLHCSVNCDGGSIELGFALALLFHKQNFAVKIVASGKLDYASDDVVIQQVDKIPEKLALVKDELAKESLPKNSIVITPKFYTDNTGIPRLIGSLPIVASLAGMNVKVIPIEKLADVLNIAELFGNSPYNPTIVDTMQKIIITHTLGAKANQTEIIEATGKEYLIGRDPSCHIAFDQDDLVSRKHCSLEIKDDGHYFLVDTSQNGTYVNVHKITSPTELNPGDKVQLGKNGPQFVFDLDPRPKQSKQTRLEEVQLAEKMARNMAAKTKETVANMENATRKLLSQAITVQHLDGANAQKSQKYDLTPQEELVFGRDTACQVTFDGNDVDMVSRKHCAISLDSQNAFILADHSTNGTFLNQQKISAPTEIKTNDQVQLGKNGPKLLFIVDPKNKQTVLQTEPSLEAIKQKASAQSIGKDTTIRLIKESIDQSQQKSRRNLGIAALVLVPIILAGYFLTQQNKPSAEPQPVAQARKPSDPAPNKPLLSAADIFKQYGNSTVLIEASWKLIHTGSGKQLFQKKDCFMKDGKCITEAMPWYIQRNGVVEPYLDDTGIAIGKSLSGSGFVVHEDGYILTNRHVAANWHAQSYRFQFPGILVQCDDAACNKPAYKLMDEKSPQEYLDSLNQWIPSKTKMLGQSPISGKIIEGRNDYLDITFPDSEHRIPGHLVGTSESADVAMIKIDVPRKLQPVQISKDDQAAPGESITVMGFPGISPEVVAKIKSHDPIGGESAVHTVPQATVTTGNIGKILNDTKPDSDHISDVYSSMGNVYQLTVNATGSGNSGGPVFNDKGHVIGLFTYSKSDQNGTQITFAVPIKYGRELMETSSAK
ncbi:MAG: FHA domain-containing protein [Methyloglobulus sp.]|nr:FHA domain-containing protein [Methyloglobulus sp.]